MKRDIKMHIRSRGMHMITPTIILQILHLSSSVEFLFVILQTVHNSAFGCNILANKVIIHKEV